MQSWRSNFCDLKKLISTHQPACICLQETLLKDRQVYPPSGYTMSVSPRTRDDGHERGVAILTRLNLHSTDFPLNTNLQAVAKKVWLGRWYTVCSVYLPHVPVAANDLENLIVQLPAPFLILGDMNARSELWGDTVTNHRGTIFENLLVNNNVSVLNISKPTHYHIQTGTQSIIDLSICSSDCILDFNHDVLDDLNGSDHYPIVINLITPNFSPSYPQRMKLDKANWTDYNDLTDFPSDQNVLDDIDTEIDRCVELLLTASRQCIPLTSGAGRKIPTPWWNDECRNALTQRKRALRALKRNYNPSNVIAYQRCRALCRVTFQAAKKASWERYVSTINERTSMKEVWSKVRKLSKKHVTYPLPLLQCANGTSSDDPLLTSELFCEAFSSVSATHNYSERFRIFKNREERRAISFETTLAQEYNSAISMKEFEYALSKTSETSPGHDQITYSLISRSNQSFKLHLLKVFNKIFLENKYPNSWRVSIIIPIAKKDKDPSLPLNYRPIALTSCLCKLMEKILNLRLTHQLESQNLFTPNQSGFRRNLSTTDSLLQFTTHVHGAIARGEHTMTVFFDLAKAYDMAWKHGILKKLHDWGLRGHLPKFIQEFLKDRKISVRVGSTLSAPRPLEEGIPQGSVLSCTLFIIAINSITSYLPIGVRSSLYVDDFTIWISSRNVAHMERKLQETLNKLKMWCDRTGFKFSPSKTVSMHICRKRGCTKQTNLALLGEQIDCKPHHKYLGIEIDSSLTWRRHIQTLKQSCLKKMDLLKLLSHKSWGADQGTLLRIYTALIKSKLEYGIEAYGSACKTLRMSLDPIQNQALRIAVGAFRSSPIDSLHCLTGVLPPGFNEEKKLLNFGLRVLYNEKNPMRNDLLELINEDDIPEMTNLQQRHFLRRLQNSLQRYEIPLLELMTPIPLNTPWTSPNISICSSLYSINKSSLSTTELKTMYQQHLSQHHDTYFIYSDGSRCDERSGYGVYADDFSVSRRVHGGSSIFTTELLGIMEAVKHSKSVRQSVITIITDSRSSIQSINSLYPTNAIVRLIHHTMKEANKFYNLCWCPSHVGVAGNECADSLAQSSLRRHQTFFNQLTREDLKAHIKRLTLKEWRNKWSVTPMRNKLRSITSNTRLLPFTNCENRQWSRILARLRIGHCSFSHGHLMNQGDPPVCEYCEDPLTVEHVLIDCPLFEEQRRRYFPVPSHRTLRYFLVESRLDGMGPLANFLRSIDFLRRI